MMSALPIDLKEVSKTNIDLEILRVGMIAELDAVNTYEQMAAKATDKNVKALLLDIAKEEKTHIAEFETMLLMLDKEFVKEIVKAKKEVEAILKK